MSLELFSNFLQALVAVAVAIWATRVAIGEKTVAYTLAAGMLDTMALGILYWLTYQFMTDMTPQVFYVADVSWLAAYLFLLALELYLTVPEVKKKRHFAMYIPIPIGIGLTLYFCQWGDVLLNISYMGVLTVCAYFAIQNLLFGDGKAKGIHIFCLVFIATEYALWIASCFWISDIWTNPYFWFDFLLTAEIGLFFPVVNRAVRP